MLSELACAWCYLQYPLPVVPPARGTPCLRYPLPTAQHCCAHRAHPHTPCTVHGCCSMQGHRGTPTPRGAQAGQPFTLTPWEQRGCPVVSTQLASRGHRERESRKANGSSRLRISGFWFPFLLPAVSMETGVGPGKIRLGFAEEALHQRLPASAPCRPHRPAGGTHPGTPLLPHPVATLGFRS